MASCPWSVILICACAAFAAAFAAELQFETTPDDDERTGQYDIGFNQRPDQRNGVGGPCRNSNHCQPQLCCLLARDHTRTCQPMSKIGQKCTNGQVKGGAYPDHCPCLEGLCSLTRDRLHNFGDNGVCVPPSQGQRPVESGFQQRPQFPRP
ncbi:uncharacterized protein [Dermacentor andersoni]|uniref:uncharacterized protein isoform X1 n=1 Tax=Dermacentor andersoni TaxID=34620 RepID=UPI002155E8F6|nr:uncharacterized protein LOC126527390 isoform X1 [Dermacentor andersoni]